MSSEFSVPSSAISPEVQELMDAIEGDSFCIQGARNVERELNLSVSTASQTASPEMMFILNEFGGTWYCVTGTPNSEGVQKAEEDLLNFLKELQSQRQQEEEKKKSDEIVIEIPIVSSPPPSPSYANGDYQNREELGDSSQEFGK